MTRPPLLAAGAWRPLCRSASRDHSRRAGLASRERGRRRASTSVAGSSRTARSASRCSGRAGTSPRSGCCGRARPLDQSAVHPARSRLQRPPGLLPALRPRVGRRTTTRACRDMAKQARPSGVSCGLPSSTRLADLLLRGGSAEDGLPHRTRDHPAHRITARPGGRIGRESCAYDRPYNWNQHATFGAPFVDAGRNLLDVSATMALTDARRTGGGQWSASAEFRGRTRRAPTARRSTCGRFARGRAGRSTRPCWTASSPETAGSRSTTPISACSSATSSPLPITPGSSTGRTGRRRQSGADGARHPVRHVAIRRGPARQRRTRTAVRHPDLSMDRRRAAALDRVHRSF